MQSQKIPTYDKRLIILLTLAGIPFIITSDGLSLILCVELHQHHNNSNNFDLSINSSIDNF